MEYVVYVADFKNHINLKIFYFILFHSAQPLSLT